MKNQSWIFHTLISERSQSDPSQMDPVAFGALKGPDLLISEGSDQSNPSKMDPIAFGALKGQEKKIRGIRVRSLGNLFPRDPSLIPQCIFERYESDPSEINLVAA